MTNKISRQLNKLSSWISVIRTTSPIFNWFFTMLVAQKTLRKFRHSKDKNVVRNIRLRTISYQGSFYSINLFSTKAELKTETIEYFKEYAESIPEYQMRTEAEKVFGVFRLKKNNGFMSYSQQLFLSLQEQYSGTYVVALTSSSKEDLDIPYIIYFDNNNSDVYRVVISQTSLKKLNIE